jgi:SAM-dependent methyltransferase
MPAGLSADPHTRLFDRIAWIYGLLFPLQRRDFRRSLGELSRRLALPRGARILDIGCGSGALASVLAQRGNTVRAVDASTRMVATARRLLARAGLQGRKVRVSPGNPLEGLAFPAGHFDLVLATHVVHGLPPAQRGRFYREARRVSRGLVLLRDYPPAGSGGPGLVLRVLEALEGSDYRRFRRRGLKELREHFAEVKVLRASTGSAWYLCRQRA